MSMPQGIKQCDLLILPTMKLTEITRKLMAETAGAGVRFNEQEVEVRHGISAANDEHDDGGKEPGGCGHDDGRDDVRQNVTKYNGRT